MTTAILDSNHERDAFCIANRYFKQEQLAPSTMADSLPGDVGAVDKNFTS